VAPAPHRAAVDRADRTRVAVVAMGWVMFLGTLAWMLTFPVHLAL
jgi:hypothetical protein